MSSHPLTGVAARAIFVLFCIAASIASGRTRQSSFETPFDRAQHMRQLLESQPMGERTRGDYQRTMDAFRSIYHSDPSSSQADASIVAVAGLLAEQGRTFGDHKSLRDSVGQYEFLRQQYPGSRYRFSALLREAQIERWDLDDHEEAKAKYQEFLKLYPENPLAVQVRTELKEMPQEDFVSQSSRPAHTHARDSVLAAAIRSQSSLDSNSAKESPRPSAAAAPSPVTNTAPSKTPLRPSSKASSGSNSLSAATPSSTVVDATEDDDDAAPPPDSQPSQERARTPVVTSIRHWSTPVYTRIAIDLSDQAQYEAARVPHPDRIYFDLHGARLASSLAGRSIDVTDDGFLKRIRAAQFSNDVTRIVLDVSPVADYSAFLLPNPWRIIIDIHGRKDTNPVTEPQPPAQEIATLSQQPGRIRATKGPTTQPISASVAGTTAAPQRDDGSLASPNPPPQRTVSKSRRRSAATPLSSPTREADPTASGERSLVRTLGLKIGRIVIDPGHGGHDSGTLGPGGMEEKEVVLDVGLRVGKLLRQRLGADVIFTRSDDTFIPLETRTAIANKAQADLFLSIHANSSSDSSARGVETYYLNFTTSPDALEVAARENAVSNESIHELSDLVKKITLKDKIDESREFAADVQKCLYEDMEDGNPGLKDRGVKKAPFVVLIGANMPSILAEISFLTNPADASELNQPAYRERIAESLYRGVAKYISGLSGVRLADNTGN